ncbi:CRISPR-associated endonuclease Cas3'' [Ectothiorhodospiraceae bacterium BW-2]|nr:CRISPR-associated endonuclease Cas3'' [Ectothiorhodospiraceae bacterium BW-2]
MKVKNSMAHYRQDDGMAQTLAEHLMQVGHIGARGSAKIGLEPMGELLGLLHDLGKYSAAFQTYLQSAVGRIDPDEDDWVDAGRLKGK